MKNKDTIYIFNPENDLALAYGRENYTAPPLATQLRADLQILPVWYAGIDAKIYANNPCNEKWLSEVENNYGIATSLVNDKYLLSCDCGFLPWGWSYDMRKRLIDRGVSIDLLPAKEYIDGIRSLSHRGSSVYINKAMSSGNEATELHDFESVKEYALRNPMCYIKAPWSSSGKGIFHVLDTEAIDFERWTRGIIKRQGSVMCEKELKNVLDFAMEFYAHDGVIKFVGYSVFQNDKHCSFDSGIVASTSKLETIINESVGNETELQSVRERIIPVLETLIGKSYNGYFGVDMMVYETAEGMKRINPCIEMNLRMTMGCVTALFAERYLHPTVHGVFKVEYHRKTELLHSRMEKLQKGNVPKFLDGKLVKGVQLLNPVYDDSLYCAYVMVD